MITINNGSFSILVTKGAYNGIYKSLGWSEGELKKADEKPPEEKPIVKIEEQKILKAEESEESEENVDFAEKPLSEMSGSELKMFAKSLGIDFSNIKKVKELRALIREKLI